MKAAIGRHGRFPGLQFSMTVARGHCLRAGAADMFAWSLAIIGRSGCGRLWRGHIRHLCLSGSHAAFHCGCFTGFKPASTFSSSLTARVICSEGARATSEREQPVSDYCDLLCDSSVVGAASEDTSVTSTSSDVQRTETPIIEYKGRVSHIDQPATLITPIGSQFETAYTTVSDGLTSLVRAGLLPVLEVELASTSTACRPLTSFHKLT